MNLIIIPTTGVRNDVQENRRFLLRLPVWYISYIYVALLLNCISSLLCFVCIYFSYMNWHHILTFLSFLLLCIWWEILGLESGSKTLWHVDKGVLGIESPTLMPDLHHISHPYWQLSLDCSLSVCFLSLWLIIYHILSLSFSVCACVCVHVCVCVCVCVMSYWWG